MFCSTLNFSLPPSLARVFLYTLQNSSEVPPAYLGMFHELCEQLIVFLTCVLLLSLFFSPVFRFFLLKLHFHTSHQLCSLQAKAICAQFQILKLAFFLLNKKRRQQWFLTSSCSQSISSSCSSVCPSLGPVSNCLKQLCLEHCPYLRGCLT